MLTHRHTVIALLVAPLLSILAWWAVGVFLAEKPQPAQVGHSYPLRENSNCRYTSGQCELENVQFKLVLTYEEGDSGSYILVHSSHALEGILIAIGRPHNDPSPMQMGAVGENGMLWRFALALRPHAAARIRLVATASGSIWFGDASTEFLQPRVTRYLSPPAAEP